MSNGKDTMFESYHGTLNLVIANSNGMVVATDSCATIMDAQGHVRDREHTHQKLFPISPNIVVAIAGYNRVSVHSAPEFTAPAAALILKYMDELRQKRHEPSYDEAVDTLSFVMNYHLTSVANINGWSNGKVNPGSYLFSMLIAGRINGKFTVSKVRLQSSVVRDQSVAPYISSNISDIQKTNVKNNMIFEAAGLDRIAREILTCPQEYLHLEEAAIQNYYHYHKTGNTAEMQLTEMLELARAMGRRDDLKHSNNLNFQLIPPFLCHFFSSLNYITDSSRL